MSHEIGVNGLMADWKSYWWCWWRHKHTNSMLSKIDKKIDFTVSN